MTIIRPIITSSSDIIPYEVKEVADRSSHQAYSNSESIEPKNISPLLNSRSVIDPNNVVEDFIGIISSYAPFTQQQSFDQYFCLISGQDGESKLFQYYNGEKENDSPRTEAMDRKVSADLESEKRPRNWFLGLFFGPSPNNEMIKKNEDGDEIL
jgi:hypothetical protein